MTKHVLFLGVIGVALSTFIWVVFNGYNDTRFTGLLFKLWFVCLLIAIVSDAFIRPAAKRAVSAFAALLSNEVGQVGCKVTQPLRMESRSAYHDQRKPPRAADYRARVPAAQNFVPEAGSGLPHSVGA